MNQPFPFKISTLIFIRDESDRFLLIERQKSPNKGCWSPIGGKLDMSKGESPYECARRETKEEIGLAIKDGDLHCFGYVSEKSYEGQAHWLMFLFNCKITLEKLPADIEEGNFNFFSREEIEKIKVPESDRKLIWPYYDRFSCNGFVGLRADCIPSSELSITEELKIGGE
ncbi:MAG: NUDIX hydrolase [Verrucomicrobiota bacterium]